jgi:amino acid adenylation domain-containing protein
MKIQDLVIQKAQQTPRALAVKGPDGEMTYAQLDDAANCFASELLRFGVAPGDRVGLWHDKSARTIAAMQGVLRIGAIYVPLDPLNPVARVQSIVNDCNIKVIVTTEARAQGMKRASPESSYSYLYIQEIALVEGAPAISPQLTGSSRERSENDIAYILYTSGSTGVPKGVCISHRNALAFVEWAVETLHVAPGDRLANHAPFHFDLSVLDIYAAFLGGAAVIIIPEGLAYMPAGLVDFLQNERITIWYSVPSVLILMMEQGNFLQIEPANLRCILFAGEPFPISHLRRLYTRWPKLRYLNLYGPTETNVCTYYEVTSLPESWTKPVPIGRACSGDTAHAQNEDGTPTKPGEIGELMVEGPTVMIGYWGKPPQGNKPYATGDLVRLQEDGNYLYVGRRDHMVKVRGYRIELGDIEAALGAHPAIHEVAVLAVGEDLNTRIMAFIACTGPSAPSLLELKRHCAERLPRYMIIDDVNVLSALPRTRNGKIDRLALAAPRTPDGSLPASYNTSLKGA